MQDVVDNPRPLRCRCRGREVTLDKLDAIDDVSEVFLVTRREVVQHANLRATLE